MILRRGTEEELAREIARLFEFDRRARSGCSRAAAGALAGRERAKQRCGWGEG